MNDNRFIKKFVNDAEIVFEDVTQEIRENRRLEITSIIVAYKKKEFDRAIRLIDMINKSSTKVVIKELEEKERMEGIYELRIQKRKDSK